MEEIDRKYPSVKIVLYGPPNSGKTTFKKVLLGQGAGEKNYQPTKETEYSEVIRQFYKKIGDRYVPSETYKLTIADTPGDPRLHDERIKGIKKSIGIMLFYDATDESSARRLIDMFREEILNAELYYNLMGVVLVGTKKDLGANKEAVGLVERNFSEFNEIVERLWGYKIPHILISNLDENEVGWSFYILETLIMDKPPLEIIEKLSATKFIQIEQVGEVVEEAPAPPRMKTAVVKPEAPKAPQTIEMEVGVERVEERPEAKAVEEIVLSPHEKIWEALEKIANLRNEIQEVVFLRRDESGRIHLAYYPRDMQIDESFKKMVLNSFRFREVGDQIAHFSNISEPKLYHISGKDKSLLIIKRRDALLVVKISGRPSTELLDILL